jgi:hypothetical protein
MEGASGPLNEVWVDVSSFYFPRDNPAVMAVLEGPMNSCKAVEAQKRSGLSLATPLDVARLYRKPEAH